MIEYCPLDSIDTINGFFPEIISIFDWINSNITDIKKKYYYQENLISVIFTYLGKKTMNFSEEQYIYLLEICNNLFLEREFPFTSGIMVMCNILNKSLSKEENFVNIRQYFNMIMGWLYVGISSWEDTEICHISLGNVSELFVEHPSFMNDYLDHILNKILEIGNVKINLNLNFLIF